MPLVLEEVEMKTARGMLGDQVLVERNPQAWFAREREAPIDDLGVAWSRLFDESLGEVIEVLLDLEVGRARGDLQRRRGGDRTANVVGRHQHVVGVGPGR